MFIYQCINNVYLYGICKIYYQNKSIIIIIIYTTIIHIFHNKSNTLKLLDKNIVRNNLLTRSKVRPAEYGSSIAPNQSEVKTTI